MLKAMRRNTKIVLWVVVASFVVGFIFIQLGMGGFTGDRYRRARERGILGEVNGIPITESQFQYALQEAYQAAREKAGGDLSEEMTEKLREETWNNLVGEILLNQVIKKLGIKVSDTEVITILRTNPPPSLLENKELQTNGKFDHNKYLQVISNPQNLPWVSQYEASIRSLLPKQKLQDALLSSARVTDLEVRNFYVAKNEKVRVNYLGLTLTNLRSDTLQTTDEEIMNYYEQHKHDFKQPARARLKFVYLEKKPSPEDEVNAEREIREIYAEARRGVDFSRLAQENSDDVTSATKGGDLGFFERGQMVKPFEDVAFSLKPGEISEPFKTPYGWHIVKLEERKKEGEKEKIRARHILLKIEPSEVTLKRLRERAEDFVQALKKIPFEQAAEERKLEIHDTGFFPQGRFIPSLGQNPQAMAFAFEGKVGRTGGLMEDKNGFYILKLSERRKEGIASLDEVRDRLRILVVHENLKRIAFQQMEALAHEIKQGKTLEQVAHSHSIELKKTGLFSREDYLPEVGAKNEFIGVAFSLPVGRISGPVLTDQGCDLIQVVEKIPIDENRFQAEKEKVREERLAEKRNNLVQEFYQELERKAKIRDYRSGEI